MMSARRTSNTGGPEKHLRLFHHVKKFSDKRHIALWIIGFLCRIRVKAAESDRQRMDGFFTAETALRPDARSG